MVMRSASVTSAFLTRTSSPISTPRFRRTRPSMRTRSLSVSATIRKTFAAEDFLPTSSTISFPATRRAAQGASPRRARPNPTSPSGASATFKRTSSTTVEDSAMGLLIPSPVARVGHGSAPSAALYLCYYDNMNCSSPRPMPFHRLRDGKTPHRDLMRKMLADGDLPPAPEAAPSLDLPEFPGGGLDGEWGLRTDTARVRDGHRGVEVPRARPPRRPALVHDLDDEPLRRQCVDDPVAVRRVPVADADPDPVGGEVRPRPPHEARDVLRVPRGPAVEDLPVPRHRHPGARPRVHAHHELPPAVAPARELERPGDGVVDVGAGDDAREPHRHGLGGRGEHRPGPGRHPGARRHRAEREPTLPERRHEVVVEPEVLGGDGQDGFHGAPSRQEPIIVGPDRV